MHFSTRTHAAVSADRVWCLLGSILLLFVLRGSAQAAELADAQKLFLDGEYKNAAKVALEGVQERPRSEDWPILLSRCYLTMGEYDQAQTTITNALSRIPWSLRLRLTAREVLLQNGQVEKAAALLSDIEGFVAARNWAARDSAGAVALGQAALLLGNDPRRVLDLILNRVKKADPGYRETYLVIGQLALDKYDGELAAKNFQEALGKFPDDPDMLYGLAKSFSTGDRSEMLPLLQKVLDRNERHVPALLLLADHLIDAEEYKKADELLDKALAVNPQHPEAWAYRAVLAHLRNQPDQEAAARKTALARWKTNPRVDYLIGLKLSQKYRFAEGSAYQRRALSANEDYAVAKSQLAQDLLRLGEEEEGWRLADDVFKQDGYDVVAYNLVTLHDTISKFQYLTNESFKVRMEPREASIYGDRVVELLSRAQKALCRKYGFELPRQTLVEMFPEQKDFAVRTFGMPGGEGFLGVCFGNVVTANSPASHAAKLINWQSVLWHEFCHVITLGLTRNKMPRWLSEGISVYEERQANPAWGEQMNRHYRQMILKDELTPVGDLSAAFLAPKTPLHLQFAYYESSLVVEFLIDQFGLDALRKILVDLGNGKAINQAIEDNTAPLSGIEKEFAAFARGKAERFGSGLDWSEPTPDELAKGEDRWVTRNPKSLWALLYRAKKALDDKQWEEAKAPLQRIIELFPEYVGADNPYLLLAEAHRGLKETDQERAVLSKLARIEADAVQAYLRLMELDTAAKDWNAAARNALRFLAVNPLVPQPYRCLGRASQELGKDTEAVRAYRTLLLLNPTDPADVHFQLASLLYKAGEPEAKRQVLQALEEAPRFRQAHRLLLQMSASTSAKAETKPPLPTSQTNDGNDATAKGTLGKHEP